MAKPNEPDMLPKLAKKGTITRLVLKRETKCLSLSKLALFQSNKFVKMVLGFYHVLSLL